MSVCRWEPAWVGRTRERDFGLLDIEIETRAPTPNPGSLEGEPHCNNKKIGNSNGCTANPNDAVATFVLTVSSAVQPNVQYSKA